MKTLGLLIILVFSLFGFTEKSRADGWMMHDLSILFPMPAKPLDSNAMIATTKTKLGELMPSSVSQSLPVLEPSLNRVDQVKRFQVVGVRIDPPEVRLIWQAFQVYPQSNGRTHVLAIDAAIHTFYQLNDVAGFAKELAVVASLSRPEVHQGLALGVHPSLAQRGWTGDYGVALKALLMKYVGEKNLFKITFAATTRINFRWDFGGSLVQDGRLVTLGIPRVDRAFQMYVNGSFPQVNFSGGFGPAPKGQDEFNRLISDSSKAQVKEPANLEGAHLTARRLENPTLESAQTVDCASCHTAQMVRYWTEAERTSLKNANEGRYTSQRFNLANQSLDRSNTGNVRSFGFFSDAAAISQRTINESALVTDKLNELSRRR